MMMKEGKGGDLCRKIGTRWEWHPMMFEVVDDVGACGHCRRADCCRRNTRDCWGVCVCYTVYQHGGGIKVLL